MISEIRRQFKVQGFKIVLWLIVISMAASFLMLRRESGPSNVLLSINGHEISSRLFEQQISKESERIQLLRQQYGPQADLYLQALGLNDPKIMAFYALVRDTLLNQVADNMGLHLAPGFVMQKLYDPQFVMSTLIDLIPPYAINPDGTINKEKLVQYLKFSGRTMTQFEESLNEAIKRILVIDVVSLAAYVDPHEVKNSFSQHYLGKQFEILIFPFEVFKTRVQEQKATQEELQNFFAEENRKTRRYWIPEKRAGIVYSFGPATYGIEVSDKEIQEYYDAHKSKYVQTPVQIQVRRILIPVGDKDSADQVQKIEEQAKKIAQDVQTNPTKFQELARTYSQDKQTATNGGLMPYFSRGTHDETFEKAAFRLKNDGDVSDLIVTDQGFEIIQRVGRKAIEYKPITTVKADIIKLLQEQKFKGKFIEDMGAIKNSPENVQKFVESKKAQKIEIPLSANDRSVRMQKLFGLKAVDQSAFYTEGNQGFFIQLTKIVPTAEPQLKEVEKQVKDDYYQVQAKKALKKALEQAKEESNQKPFESLATQGIVFEKTGFIKRDDETTLAKLAQKNIPLPIMFSLEQPGAVVEHNDKDGYLIKLNAIQPLNEESFNKEKSAIERELYNEQRMLVENGFIASLFRNATIKSMDPQFNTKG